MLTAGLTTGGGKLVGKLVAPEGPAKDEAVKGKEYTAQGKRTLAHTVDSQHKNPKPNVEDAKTSSAREPLSQKKEETVTKQSKGAGGARKPYKSIIPGVSKILEKLHSSGGAAVSESGQDKKGSSTPEPPGCPQVIQDLRNSRIPVMEGAKDGAKEGTAVDKAGSLPKEKKGQAPADGLKSCAAPNNETEMLNDSGSMRDKSGEGKETVKTAASRRSATVVHTRSSSMIPTAMESAKFATDRAPSKDSSVSKKSEASKGMPDKEGCPEGSESREKATAALSKDLPQPQKADTVPVTSELSSGKVEGTITPEPHNPGPILPSSMGHKRRDVSTKKSTEKETTASLTEKGNEEGAVPQKQNWRQVPVTEGTIVSKTVEAAREMVVTSQAKEMGCEAGKSASLHSTTPHTSEPQSLSETSGTTVPEKGETAKEVATDMPKQKERVEDEHKAAVHRRSPITLERPCPSEMSVSIVPENEGVGKEVGASMQVEEKRDIAGQQEALCAAPPATLKPPSLTQVTGNTIPKSEEWKKEAEAGLPVQEQGASTGYQEAVRTPTAVTMELPSLIPKCSKIPAKVAESDVNTTESSSDDGASTAESRRSNVASPHSDGSLIPKKAECAKDSLSGEGPKGKDQEQLVVDAPEARISYTPQESMIPRRTSILGDVEGEKSVAVHGGCTDEGDSQMMQMEVVAASCTASQDSLVAQAVTPMQMETVEPAAPRVGKLDVQVEQTEESEATGIPSSQPKSTSVAKGDERNETAKVVPAADSLAAGESDEQEKDALEPKLTAPTGTPPQDKQLEDGAKEGNTAEVGPDTYVAGRPDTEVRETWTQETSETVCILSQDTPLEKSTVEEASGTSVSVKLGSKFEETATTAPTVATPECSESSGNQKQKPHTLVDAKGLGREKEQGDSAGEDDDGSTPHADEEWLRQQAEAVLESLDIGGSAVTGVGHGAQKVTVSEKGERTKSVKSGAVLNGRGEKGLLRNSTTGGIGRRVAAKGVKNFRSSKGSRSNATEELKPAFDNRPMRKPGYFSYCDNDITKDRPKKSAPASGGLKWNQRVTSTRTTGSASVQTTPPRPGSMRAASSPSVTKRVTARRSAPERSTAARSRSTRTALERPVSNFPRVRSSLIPKTTKLPGVKKLKIDTVAEAASGKHGQLPTPVAQALRRQRAQEGQTQAPGADSVTSESQIPKQPLHSPARSRRSSAASPVEPKPRANQRRSPSVASSTPSRTVRPRAGTLSQLRTAPDRLKAPERKNRAFMQPTASFQVGGGCCKQNLERDLIGCIQNNRKQNQTDANAALVILALAQLYNKRGPFSAGIQHHLVGDEKCDMFTSISKDTDSCISRRTSIYTSLDSSDHSCWESHRLILVWFGTKVSVFRDRIKYYP